MKSNPTPRSSRREFLKTAGAAAATASVAPNILGAGKKSGNQPAIVGEGEFKFECHHNWGEVPDTIQWGATHGVTHDEEGLIYIKHRVRVKGQDAIAVFDPKGKFVRSFGAEFGPGGHGIDIRKEGGEEFLYISNTGLKTTAKLTLKGEKVWEMGIPKEPGVYDGPKARYSPTNICFSPDGGFYVGDGYGSSYIHQYDQDAKWVRTWGGVGEEPGKMRTPHGQWFDDRPGRAPSLAIADRANARLQYFTTEGKHIGFVHDLSFPADIDIQGETMLVPDLHARVTLLDINNKVITHLGYDPKWTEQVLEKPDGKSYAMRGQPERWVDGKFVHPHDACFDRDGNIFVVEWVTVGRVTKLRKVS